MTATTVLEPSPAGYNPWSQAGRPWLNLYGLRVRQGKRKDADEVMLHLLTNPYHPTGSLSKEQKS